MRLGILIASAVTHVYLRSDRVGPGPGDNLVVGVAVDPLGPADGGVVE
jgi:hypothetical protein